jgi:heme oxygenase (mycobilin-producing)
VIQLLSRLTRIALASAFAAAALVAALPAAAQEGKVVLINVFEVPAAADQETLRLWERSRDFLKSQPGFISTRLHRNLDPDGRFRYVNVAEWESASAFRAASEGMSRFLGTKWPEGVRYTPSLFRVVAQ